MGKQCYIIVAVAFSLVVLLIFFLWPKKRKKYELDNAIEILYRQCARWLVAAEQDKSPLIATLHAQYGIGYLSAIKELATHQEFKRATGTNLDEFEQKAKAIQDKVTRRAVAYCPQFASELDVYFAKKAGDM